MIDETIERIRDRIAGSPALDESKKDEILRMLGDLKQEVDGLARTQADDAEHIAGFLNISTTEATRGSGNPDLLELARKGLSLSIREFETTHPKLVEAANGISSMLSNLGI